MLGLGWIGGLRVGWGVMSKKQCRESQRTSRHCYSLSSIFCLSVSLYRILSYLRIDAMISKSLEPSMFVTKK